MLVCLAGVSNGNPPMPESLRLPGQTVLSRDSLRRLLVDYDRQYGISRTSEWRRLSGWKRRLVFLVWADNQDARGYADAEGMKSPREDFVSTGLAYFLPPDTTVEESIKCRIPDKYRFMQQLFPDYLSPLDDPAIQCASIGSGFLDDVALYDVNGVAPISMGLIQPDTVEGFEVLYATPGSGDISEVAGHLLLRIKLNNNPRARQLGIENPNDLVISFLADTERGATEKRATPLVVQADCGKMNWFNLVEDGAADERPLESIWQSIRGLCGGYHVIMDRQSLGEAIMSYTVEQDRDLLRYELNLSESMKADLLARLYEVKKNYQPRYYFFSKNCGTVLVRVIGQGIDDEEISGFDPMVSPPHTLVGLLVRKGLATRKAPSFYGTSKRGRIAQQLFAEGYRELIEHYPDDSWPRMEMLFHSSEKERANAVRMLGLIGMHDSAMYSDLYRLVSIYQEAEMVHRDKGMICEDYTTEPTAEARRLQQHILLISADIEPLRLEVNERIASAYAPVEIRENSRGSMHTGHYVMQVGAGMYGASDPTHDGFVLTLQGALLQQEMGSPSRLAMQRGGSLELGGFSMVFDDEEVKQWRATGLRLRKFRDTLNRVPSCFASTRGWGLGLRSLDVDHDGGLRRTKGTLIGGEVIGNIISSPQHSSYLFFAIGSDVNYYHYASGHENVDVMIPFGMEGLVGLDANMRWQWRSAAMYGLAVREENGNEFRAGTEIRCRLGEFMRSEWTLGAAMTYRHDDESESISDSSESWLWQVNLQINRW
jgi:hypothetical protein